MEEAKARTGVRVAPITFVGDEFFYGTFASQWPKIALIWNEVMLPYFVGGLLPGLVTSIGFYYLVRAVVATYQAARRRRLFRQRTGGDG